jgi:hypothetical protein
VGVNPHDALYFFDSSSSTLMTSSQSSSAHSTTRPTSAADPIPAPTMGSGQATTVVTRTGSSVTGTTAIIGRRRSANRPIQENHSNVQRVYQVISRDLVDLSVEVEVQVEDDEGGSGAWLCCC